MYIFNNLLVDVSMSTCQASNFYNDVFDRNKARVDFDDYFTFKREQISIFDFVQKIAQGYVFCYCFKGGENYFDKNVLTDDNFAFTNFVVIEFYDVSVDMNTYLSKVPLKPTIAYTYEVDDCHGGKNYMYKLIYFFDTKITSVDAYRRIQGNIISMLNSSSDVKIKYDALKCPVNEIFQGTRYDFKEFYREPWPLLFNNVVYDINDFNKYYSNDEDGIDEMFSFEKKQEEERNALAAKIFEQFKKSE